MRIEIGLFLNVERTPKDEPERRESDIPGTAMERLPEFEEGVGGTEARRVGFRMGGA